ncbi:MAG: hypothetical protein ACRCYQ_05480 [Nocardioides sp.]
MNCGFDFEGVEFAEQPPTDYLDSFSSMADPADEPPPVPVPPTVSPTPRRSLSRAALAAIGVLVLAAVVFGLTKVGSPQSTPAVRATSDDPGSTATESVSPSPSPSESSSASPEPTPSESAAATVTGRCWDGAEATDEDRCSAPKGRRGIEWLFPALDLDDCKKNKAFFTNAQWDCTMRADGGRVGVHYIEWDSMDLLRSDFRRKYRRPSTRAAEDIRLWQLPRARYAEDEWVATKAYRKIPFSVSVETRDTRLGLAVLKKIEMRSDKQTRLGA